MWLGDFTGGELNFDDGDEVEGERERRKINGHIHHWNDPHEGTQYSIVRCRGAKKRKSRTQIEGKRAKCDRELKYGIQYILFSCVPKFRVYLSSIYLVATEVANSSRKLASQQWGYPGVQGQGLGKLEHLAEDFARQE